MTIKRVFTVVSIKNKTEYFQISRGAPNFGVGKEGTNFPNLKVGKRRLTNFCKILGRDKVSFLYLLKRAM